MDLRSCSIQTPFKGLRKGKWMGETFKTAKVTSRKLTEIAIWSSDSWFRSQSSKFCKKTTGYPKDCTNWSGSISVDKTSRKLSIYYCPHLHWNQWSWWWRISCSPSYAQTQQNSIFANFPGGQYVAHPICVGKLTVAEVLVVYLHCIEQPTSLRIHYWEQPILQKDFRIDLAEDVREPR